MLHQLPLSITVVTLKIRAERKFLKSRRKKPNFVPAPFLVGVELNPGPIPSEHLSEKDRWWIVFYSEENRLNPTQISRKMGCTRRTVYEVLEKERETHSVKDRPRSGRKRKLTTAEEKRVVKKAQKVGATQAARDFSSHGSKTITDFTVRKVLKKYKFFYLKRKKIPRLTQDQKEKRMNYAREMMDIDWNSVLFTDEKSFWLGSTTDSAWQQRNHRIEVETSKWTPKLHVWGGIGSYFKSKLYFFEENMKAPLYQQILRQRLPPTSAPDCPRKKRKQWYFVQDNDPKHKSKKSMELIRELTENRFYKHPPLSPDFNVMEDVWSYLDREVRKSRVTSIRGLKCKLTQLWDSITWEQFRPNVESMPQRLQQCLNRHGGRTDYY